MKFKQLLLFFIVSILINTGAEANIMLPAILGDHMVLQRNQSVPIWGMADPGEAIQVSFKGQSKMTTANSAGKWQVLLDPLTASFDPAVLRISGKNQIELSNILVGEVWLCSGQSNMQWTLEQSNGGDEAIQQADQPYIRLFNVSREVAFKKKDGPLANWAVCTPGTVPDFSGVGYFFGLDLQKALNVPIGLINSSYGGSQAEAWTPVEYLAASPDLVPCIEREKIWAAERPQVKADFEKATAEWKIAVEKAKTTGEKPPRPPRVPDALRDYRIAASIYNSMIAPLLPFAIQGALWYQGESNEERAEQFEILLPTMIRSWREQWRQGDFPFAIIQLPNFREPSPEPEDKAWSHIREAQRITALSLPKASLIVTIDLGEAKDIHPRNKLDVGHRLSRWALADVYGRKITKTGPMLRRSKVSKNKIILWFDEAGNGLQTCKGEALHEFAIAGEDQQWHWAKAKIVGKKKVVVWSEKVSKPQAVRYAFNNNPVAPNLTNETCIPASPFRTDKWPGPTAGKR